MANIISCGPYVASGGARRPPICPCRAASVRRTRIGGKSLKELPYGSPAEQEIALEARHAPRPRFPHPPCARGRADDGRSASAPPHQPERLLPRQEGRQDQERIGRRPARATRGAGIDPN